MNTLSRREFSGGLIKSLLTSSLLPLAAIRQTKVTVPRAGLTSR
jgi:hypothetical protein